MLFLFYSLRNLVKNKNIVTDGLIFRLHCRWTVLVLLCASVLLTCRENFGDPIECIQNDVRRIKVVETFCWIHSTFIIPSHWNATIGSEVPHPGIGSYTRGKNRVYQAYYQWVAMVLFLQAIMFYAPKYLWRCCEKKTMKALSLDLQNALLPQEQAEKSIKLLVKSLSSHWGYFGSYFRSYIICEFLTLVNVGVQLLLMDAFFSGAFTSLGIKVLQWSEWNQEYRTDPLVETFPRMTKCEFFEFGSSGSVQKRDALCLLPLNILNEKIFIFLWFWLLFLCGVTVLIILFHLLLIKLPILRYCVLISTSSKTNKGALDKLLAKSSVSDWFVMYLLAKNIYPAYYNQVVEHLTFTMTQNGHLYHGPSISNEKMNFV